MTIADAVARGLRNPDVVAGTGTGRGLVQQLKITDDLGGETTATERRL